MYKLKKQSIMENAYIHQITKITVVLKVRVCNEKSKDNGKKMIKTEVVHGTNPRYYLSLELTIEKVTSLVCVLADRIEYYYA